MDNRHFGGPRPLPGCRPSFGDLEFSAAEINELLKRLVKMQDVEGLVSGVNIVNIENHKLLQPGNLTLEDLGAARLENMNDVFVPWQGSAYATRNYLPALLRRKGISISYVTDKGIAVKERAVSDVGIDNANWGIDSNWMRVDELSLNGKLYVSPNGTWVINGVDTGIQALGPKGDNGLTPRLKTIDNKLHYSYDGKTWLDSEGEYISAWFRWSGNKIQISRDNKIWEDFSGEFADNLFIKGYVATFDKLPADAVQGDIWGVGPRYAVEDTEQTQPIYRYWVRNADGWVDNGEFTSIAAGIVQETGDGEGVVMSQKAVSGKLAELESQEGYTLMAETERQDGVALTIEGVIESSIYVSVGTIFTYTLKKNRIYQIEAYAAPFSLNYSVACLYKNGAFVKYLGRCNNDIHKEHITIDTQYMDVDTIKVCSYNNQGYLGKYYVWESANIAKENIPIEETKGFEKYKINIETIPLIAEESKKNSNYINELQQNERALNIEYHTDEKIAFDNVEIGGVVSFKSDMYRHIINADISGCRGIIFVENILANGDLVGIVITDKNGVVLTTTYVNSYENYRNSFINLEAYPTAEKLYSIIANNTSAPATKITLLAKRSIIAKSNEVFLAINSINGYNSELNYMIYYRNSLADAELNKKYQFVADIYRGTFVVPVSEYIGCTVKLEKVNPSNKQAVLVVDKDDKVIAIIPGEQGVYNTIILDLSQYIDAEYILFAASPSEPHLPIISLINKNVDDIIVAVEGIENSILEYSSISGAQPMSGLNIGDSFATQDSYYRSVAVANVKKMRGNVKITNILGGDGKDVFVVDNDNKILDILSGSTNVSYVHEVIVDLEKYDGNAATIYVKAAPTGETNYNQPVITNWYNGLKERVSDLENIMPKGGVVILHFDVNPYSNKKVFDILAEYGFPASWALEDSAFGDGSDNTFSTWRSDEYKNAFWDALKRGDDVGIYPSLIASQYDEAGWKRWLDVALNNLANHGIHNVSSFFCGRLDINDDLLNAVKSRGFKFIRGGGAGDSQSVDTYPYTEQNEYMPIKATHEQFFVNSTFFIGAGTDVSRFEAYVNKAIDNNAAISVFAHVIEEDEDSPVNITEAKFRAIMDVFKEKVNAGKLQMMTWREYYRCINRLKGEEWDYNRLLKMSMPKDL